jgi:hypothetical protein
MPLEAHVASGASLFYTDHGPEGGGGWAFSGEPTADGGYILTGVVNATQTDWEDIWVLKLDEQGTHEWHKSFGAKAFDPPNSERPTEHGRAIRETADGGYILAGHVKPAPNPVGTDFAVMRLAGDGTPAWQRRYGNPGNQDDKAYAVEQTADGGYIVAGEGVPGDGKNATLMVFKLDANGEIQLQKGYGEYDWWEKRAGARAVQQTADGGYIVAGYREVPDRGNDLWILKLNGDLTVDWQRRYGGTGGDMAWSIRQTAEGGYLVAGETWSWGAGSADAWVLKLDQTGEILWQKAYGGIGEDRAQSVAPTNDGGAIVSGTLSTGGWKEMRKTKNR